MMNNDPSLTYEIFNYLIFFYRVIGAVIIVIGLYCVVWGKSKDPVEPSPSTDKLKGGSELPMTNSSKTVLDGFGPGGDTLMVQILAKEPTSKK